MAGLEREECRTVACSRIAGAPAALECRMRQIVTLEGKSNFMVIGEITGIHLREDCLVDGRFDVTRYRPLARLGYRDYTVVETLFPMNRPDET